MSNVATPPPPPSPPSPPSSGPAPEAAEPPPARVAYAPAPPRRRGGLLLAGLGLAVALVAGGAGFALGHATADGPDGPHRVFHEGPPGLAPFGPRRGEGQPPGSRER